MAETLNTGAEATDTMSAPAGHDEQMAQAFDNAQQMPADAQPESPAADRPEWLPEKFQSPEELAKAYAELEKRLGKPADKTEQTQEGEQATPEQADEALKAKGLDMTEFTTEFAQTGELSDGSYEKLEQAGYPRDMVDAWIAGQQALAAQTRNEVLSTIGGEEQFNAMAQWAKANLPEADINAFNRMVDSNDLATQKMAVQALYGRYQQAAGSEPSLVSGETSGSPSGSAFTSSAQVVEAMSDPRYHTDPSYRQSVQDRLQRSNVF